MSKAYIELESGTVIETDTPEYWTEGKRLKNSDGAARVKVEARNALLEMLGPGSVVYTVLRHVSASGMSRRIDLYTIIDNKPRYLSGYAAKVLGDRLHKDGGIVVGGCGMDMGFHLVNNLSIALFCPGKYEHDGAYALKHEWL